MIRSVAEYPLELPVFELTPSTSQVAFEGDKLPLECRVTEPPAGILMNVTWTRGGSSVTDPEEIQTDKSRGLIVHVRTEPDRTLVTTLVVERLDAQRDSGNWTCRVTTSHGGVTERSVRVVVLSGSASSSSQYCPLSVTESNRGRYLWSRTLAGVEQELECTVTDVKPPRSAVARAKRLCDVGGRWSEPNVSQCGYTSDTTRLLEELSFVSF